ncbi:transposase [Chromohalobacter israelensis]|uniref:transposase n=1 Tax=Chromohalobacter israelensis TaxID=141390 RepID=UPI000D709932|nr:transposase [Chromohalobacter salexigens]PWW32648.1 DDE family transposase [Chromohalobacter salexigens]
MPNIQFRASGRTLTSHAGLSIIGQCIEMAGIDSLDARFPSQGVPTSDIVKAYLGLLCLGMSDFDAIENFRRDTPFRQLLNLQKVPSTATLLQRLEKLAAQDLHTLTAAWSMTLLSLAEAPITADKGHVCLDIDTFVMDNSHSRKEGVTRTCQKVDGYTPIAAYLGNEGGWTSLDATPVAVIQRYQAHATHEQFPSEIKTDLDLERLPSDKFATNDLILHLAQLAYNILRLMGQLGMTGELSPVRHPAKRRRLRTVLQELVHRAALVIHKARQTILDFGQDVGRMTVLKTLRHRFRYPKTAPC